MEHIVLGSMLSYYVYLRHSTISSKNPCRVWRVQTIDLYSNVFETEMAIRSEQCQELVDLSICLQESQKSDHGNDNVRQGR